MKSFYEDSTDIIVVEDCHTGAGVVNGQLGRWRRGYCSICVVQTRRWRRSRGKKKKVWRSGTIVCSRKGCQLKRRCSASNTSSPPNFLFFLPLPPLHIAHIFLDRSLLLTEETRGDEDCHHHQLISCLWSEIFPFHLPSILYVPPSHTLHPQTKNSSCRVVYECVWMESSLLVLIVFLHVLLTESIKDKVKKDCSKTTHYYHATIVVSSFGEWLVHYLGSMVKGNPSWTPAHAHISLPYPHRFRVSLWVRVWTWTTTFCLTRLSTSVTLMSLQNVDYLVIVCHTTPQTGARWNSFGQRWMHIDAHDANRTFTRECHGRRQHYESRTICSGPTLHDRVNASRWTNVIEHAIDASALTFDDTNACDIMRRDFILNAACRTHQNMSVVCWDMVLVRESDVSWTRLHTVADADALG